MVHNEAKKFLDSEENHPKIHRGALIDKYNIPIQHFEYSYIEKCNDGRELEKIVQILRSGEEGYFPDLTKFAENRLTVVKPKSKLLRQACPVITKQALSNDERNEITDDLSRWIDTVSRNDNELAYFKNKKTSNNIIPQIREKKKKLIDETKTKTKRIASTDYSSWDKYDPDTEILKMDLEEEKMKKTAMENKKKSTNKKSVQFKDFMTDAEALHQAIYEKDKGNEFFKVGDYRAALRHYTNSIKCKPTLATFTNRALTHIKIKKYKNAIDDCHSALAIEPENIKALIRKTQALEGLGRHREALETIERAIEIDPNNTTAQELAEECRRACEITPKNSTRFVIEEIENKKNNPTNEILNNNKSDVIEENVKSRRKNSLKEEITDRMKNQVIIPIPGTSNMSPPHYITCSEGNSKKIRDETRRVANHTQILHMITIDNSDLDDDDSCTIDHFKSDKSNCRQNITDNKKNQENENPKQLIENTCEKKKINRTVIKDACDADKEKITPQLVNKKTILEQVHKQDIRAGGEPCFTENHNIDIPEEINSPYSFLKAWNSANNDKSLEQHAAILKNVDTNRIIDVIGCKLDSDMFSTMLKCLCRHFAVPGEVHRLQVILQSIVDLPRFGIISLLMSPEDRNSVNALVNFLKQHGKSVSQEVVNKFFDS